MARIKQKTIGFIVIWCNEIAADDTETGCDVELQNINKQPLRTKKEAQQFINRYLSAYKDVSIAKVVSL